MDRCFNVQCSFNVTTNVNVSIIVGGCLQLGGALGRVHRVDKVSIIDAGRVGGLFYCSMFIQCNVVNVSIIV